MVVVVFRTDGDWSEKDAKKVQVAIKKAMPKLDTMSYFQWFWTSCPEGEGCEDSVVEFMEQTRADLE